MSFDRFTMLFQLIGAITQRTLVDVGMPAETIFDKLKEIFRKVREKVGEILQLAKSGPFVGIVIMSVIFLLLFRGL